MSVIQIEDLDDRKWLRQVHGINSVKYPVVLLYGNQDSPTKVECYARDHYQCVPAVWEPGPRGGKLRRTQQGEEP